MHRTELRHSLNCVLSSKSCKPTTAFFKNGCKIEIRRHGSEALEEFGETPFRHREKVAVTPNSTVSLTAAYHLSTIDAEEPELNFVEINGLEAFQIHTDRWWKFSPHGASLPYQRILAHIAHFAALPLPSPLVAGSEIQPYFIHNSDISNYGFQISDV
jgi:hypothetical protein